MIIKEYKNKTVLKGMSLDEIKQWCQEHNQSPYRAQQIYQWMYKHGVQDAEEMENISQDLRNTIGNLCVLETLKIEKIDKSEIGFQYSFARIYNSSLPLESLEFINTFFLNPF